MKLAMKIPKTMKMKKIKSQTDNNYNNNINNRRSTTIKKMMKHLIIK